jgi:hypothetical protein
MSRSDDPSGSEPVAVGYAAGRLEAQMIKGMLEAEGIRCLVRSSRAGRSVMVHPAHAEKARALLAEVEARAETEAGSLPEFTDDEEWRTSS